MRYNDTTTSIKTVWRVPQSTSNINKLIKKKDLKTNTVQGVADPDFRFTCFTLSLTSRVCLWCSNKRLFYVYLFLHGLRTHNEAFFSLKFRTFGQINSGAFGIFFGWTISTHFGTVSPLSMFSIIQPLFLQKSKLLYPHPKSLFGIEIWIWTAKN